MGVKHFRQIDDTNSGEITWEQFREYIKNEDVLAYFMSQDINLLDARNVFHLVDSLDGQTEESINLESFLLGMLKIVGKAKGTDLAMLVNETRMHTVMLHEFVQSYEQAHDGEHNGIRLSEVI